MKRGFGSPNYPIERRREMSRLGGKRSHLKGHGFFESMGIEERIAFAKKGQIASLKSRMARKKRYPADSFDVQT